MNDVIDMDDKQNSLRTIGHISYLLHTIVAVGAVIPTFQPGIACHTGRHSCFFQLYKDGAWQTTEPVLKDPGTIYK